MEETLETDVDRRARAWRKSGHTIAWLFAQRYREELDEALYDVIEPLRDDEPINAEDVRRARTQLDQTRQLLEEWLVPMVDGVESWDGGAGSTTPYNVFAEHLESAGYTVVRPNGDSVIDETAECPSCCPNTKRR